MATPYTRYLFQVLRMLVECQLINPAKKAGQRCAVSLDKPEKHDEINNLGWWKLIIDIFCQYKLAFNFPQYLDD